MNLHPLDLHEVGVVLRRVVPPAHVEPSLRDIIHGANLPWPSDAYTDDHRTRLRGHDPDRMRAEQLVHELELRGYEIRRSTP